MLQVYIVIGNEIVGEIAITVDIDRLAIPKEGCSCPNCKEDTIEGLYSHCNMCGASLV